MSGELLIRGGTLVTASESVEADLLLRGGKIEARGGDLQTDGEVVDATGQLVMPGGIDTHVHLAHPIDRMGIETADDFYSGTVAAACGGVTTIIDFALQRRGDGLMQALERRDRQARGQAVVDYGFHVIVTDVRPEVLAEIPACIEAGFPSFKIYMTYSDKIVRDDALLRILEVTASEGGLVYLHCENDCAINHLIERFLAAGKTQPAFHASSRPPQVEDEATYRAIMLAELTGASICVAHVTSAAAMGHVDRARRRGLAVVCETCPQYLVLTESEYRCDRGFEAAKFVCSPPLRDAEHGEALWRGLSDGSIQQVASDHAPFDFAEQKQRGRDDFTSIPNGLPGIETRLPLLFSEGVDKGRINVNQFVALVATNPAKMFGLYPRKGSLQEGADADLVLIDPQRDVEIDHARLHSRVDYNPYQGMRLRGVPTLTLSRGEVVSRLGEPTAERGRGELLSRAACEPSALP